MSEAKKLAERALAHKKHDNDGRSLHKAAILRQLSWLGYVLENHESAATYAGIGAALLETIGKK